MSKRKTKDFKDRQCRYCELADRHKFRQGEPCCPLPNPRIRNGHCLDRHAAAKPISMSKRAAMLVDLEVKRESD